MVITAKKTYRVRSWSFSTLKSSSNSSVSIPSKIDRNISLKHPRLQNPKNVNPDKQSAPILERTRTLFPRKAHDRLIISTQLIAHHQTLVRSISPSASNPRLQNPKNANHKKPTPNLERTRTLSPRKAHDQTIIPTGPIAHHQIDTSITSTRVLLQRNAN